MRNYTVVYQIKDTIFWKQITTVKSWIYIQTVLFIRSKIQFFESKSQLKCNLSIDYVVVYQIKDTIFWKQITTQYYRLCLFLGCLSDQRYNFLKANHNKRYNLDIHLWVVYQIKDTIFWKQITTMKDIRQKFPRLFIRSKIQFFESKSQRASQWIWSPCVVYQIKDTIFWKQITTCIHVFVFFNCCLSDQRYNFLKANHNLR